MTGRRYGATGKIGNTIMPIYMFQESTSEAWAVQIRNPQNRMDVARQLIEAQGASY